MHSFFQTSSITLITGEESTFRCSVIKFELNSRARENGLNKINITSRFFICVQSAGESDSNPIPFQLSADCPSVLSKCRNETWLCLDWASLLSNLKGCCISEVRMDVSSSVVA